jgi:hypothetical protein
MGTAVGDTSYILQKDENCELVVGRTCIGILLLVF